MALFKKEDILKGGKDSEKTFVLDCFVIPEDEDTPTLTITINNVVREAEHSARVVFETVPIDIRDEKRDAKIVRDPAQYLRAVLKKAYKESEGLIDESTKPAIMELIRQQPRLAQYLCEKMLSYFEDADLYKERQEEEDEKN